MDELEKLRAEIDRLDDELLKILGMRFVATRKIGDIKKVHHFAATDESRLTQLLQTWRNRALENEIPADLIESILFSIHKTVVKEHQEILQPNKLSQSS